jgi:hypothetical protein
VRAEMKKGSEVRVGGLQGLPTRFASAARSTEGPNRTGLPFYLLKSPMFAGDTEVPCLQIK